jgi:hypothetical protein
MIFGELSLWFQLLQSLFRILRILQKLGPKSGVIHICVFEKSSFWMPKWKIYCSFHTRLSLLFMQYYEQTRQLVCIIALGKLCWLFGWCRMGADTRDHWIISCDDFIGWNDSSFKHQLMSIHGTERSQAMTEISSSILFIRAWKSLQRMNFIAVKCCDNRPNRAVVSQRQKSIYSIIVLLIDARKLANEGCYTWMV